MLKRALALVMVLSLALGAAAMAEENAFGWEVPEETLRIYTFNNSSNFATGEEQDLGIENMKAYMLENFNVDYEVITTEGDADEQLNLMLASDTYPDIIVGASTVNRQKFVDQGRAVDLTDYIANCPNLQHRMGDMLGLYADEDVTFAKTAVEDAWKQYYPLVIMADTDEAFEAAWTDLQMAVESAGLETYAQYRAENYQHNLELMAE